MKALLGSQDAWQVVEESFEEPKDTTGYLAAQNKALKELRSKDKATLYMLFQAVFGSGFEKIARATTSKEAWDTLEKVFKGIDRVKQVRLQTLRDELECMKMNESENVSDYITRVQTVVNQLNRNGEMLPETRVVEKILRLLTNNFENVVCGIEESKDLATFTVDGSLVLSRHTSNVRRRRRRHSFKHFKPRHLSKMKRYSTLKIFKIEFVEVTKMVEVVKTAVMKDIIRRRDSQAKQIGVEEDAIKEEATNQPIPIFSAINVKNMVNMRIIVTPTNVTIMVEWDMLQKIVVPEKGWKEQPT